MTKAPLTTQAEDRRVAVFGGAFDPFHSGHAAAIRHLLESEKVDRVIVMPSGDRPDKQTLSLAQDRLEMSRLGVAAYFGGDPRVEVSDLQATGRVGYATIDLVSYFAGTGVRSPLIVIGAELVKDLPQWRDAEALKKNAKFLVLRRPGAESGLTESGWDLTLSKPFGAAGVAISSTELRSRLRKGEMCADFVEQAVYDYCQKRRLYSA